MPFHDKKSKEKYKELFLFSISVFLELSNEQLTGEKTVV